MHTHAYSIGVYAQTYNAYTSIHIAYIYIRILDAYYIRMHICIHACMYVFVYAYTYVLMHACI